MNGTVQFSRSYWRKNTINPFINDSKVQKMKESDKFKYMVIYPETFITVNVDGFTNRDNAFSHAVKISDRGLWVYMIRIEDDHVLTSHCSKK